MKIYYKTILKYCCYSFVNVCKEVFHCVVFFKHWIFALQLFMFVLFSFMLQNMCCIVKPLFCHNMSVYVLLRINSIKFSTDYYFVEIGGLGYYDISLSPSPTCVEYLIKQEAPQCNQGWRNQLSMLSKSYICCSGQIN